MNTKLQRLGRTLYLLQQSCSPDEVQRILQHAADKYRLGRGSEQANAGKDAVEIEGIRAWRNFIDGNNNPADLDDALERILDTDSPPADIGISGQLSARTTPPDDDIPF